MADPEKKDQPEEQEWPRRKRIPRPPWEGAVEKSIREAMERGDFDNLSGQGKPLDLRRDPNTPAEWEMAFKLLKDAGFAPAWIEMAKELRAARAALFAPFDNYLARLVSNRGTASERDQAQLISDFRERARELNGRIDTFNLQAPSTQVHQTRIRIQEEIEKFRAAVEKWNHG